MIDSLSCLDRDLKKINEGHSLHVICEENHNRAFASLIESFTSDNNEVEVFYDQAVSQIDAAMDKEWIDLLLNVDDVDSEGYVKLNSLVTTALNDNFDRYLINGAPPKSYGKFTSIFDSLRDPPAPLAALATLPPPLPTIPEVLRKVSSLSLASLKLPDLTPPQSKALACHLGGESTALARMDKVLADKRYVTTFEKPKTSPNSLEASTTQLSFYFSNGILSCRSFYEGLAKIERESKGACSKPPVSLRGQMLWREYNYLHGYAVDNFTKQEGNSIARQIDWDEDEEKLRRWREGRTGFPFVDALIRQLIVTGWIHHLGRHMVACFLTRGDLYQSWEMGAKVFEGELLDADTSVNAFNWQWLSCTAHFYQYFRCYSPIAFGKKTDKSGAFIRKWCPELKRLPDKFIYEPFSGK